MLFSNVKAKDKYKKIFSVNKAVLRIINCKNNVNITCNDATTTLLALWNISSSDQLGFSLWILLATVLCQRKNKILKVSNAGFWFVLGSPSTKNKNIFFIMAYSLFSCYRWYHKKKDHKKIFLTKNFSHRQTENK